MLPHFWLLTLLAPLALGDPVPRESVTPSVRVSESKSNTKNSNSPEHLGLNRANKIFFNLKGKKPKTGSETISIDKGSPSLGGYSAHGTGVSYSISTGTPGKNSGATPEGDTDGLSRRSSDQMCAGACGGTPSDGGASKEFKRETSYGGHGEHGKHVEDGDDLKGGKMQERESHSSGTRSGGASKAGSDGMTTGSGGTTPGNDFAGTTGTTAGSEDNISGTATGGEGTTGSDEISTSTSKHKWRLA